MEHRGSHSEIELVMDTPSISPAENHRSVVIIAAKRYVPSILTRFHAGYFRISLSLGGQALLWRTFIIEPTDHDTNAIRRVLHNLPHTVFLILWSFALFAQTLLSVIYALRCFFYFHMVKAEFLHHVGVNYLFAPWISWLLLLQSAPFVAPETASYLVLWWVFALPVVALDVKIYGQWFTKGKKFLCAVANPTSQISVIGNLVGAQAAAKMGWRESAVCLFSLGMVHYLVLFVTLYQRYSGSDRIPVMLRPVFFLFFAAPSMASLAWESIDGNFGTGSKMLFFLSLFLFTSLVFRPNLFKKSMRRFNVAWWAYSFPVTILALASAEYAREVKGGIAHVLMVILLALSVLIALGLVLFTLFNTKMLLPDHESMPSLPLHLPRRSS